MQSKNSSFLFSSPNKWTFGSKAMVRTSGRKTNEKAGFSIVKPIALAAAKHTFSTKKADSPLSIRRESVSTIGHLRFSLACIAAVNKSKYDLRPAVSVFYCSVLDATKGFVELLGEWTRFWTEVVAMASIGIIDVGNGRDDSCSAACASFLEGVELLDRDGTPLHFHA